ncbi:MAG TPA: hypothetical protein VGM77_09110 [Gemmatimonadales bacterium]
MPRFLNRAIILGLLIVTARSAQAQGIRGPILSGTVLRVHTSDGAIVVGRVLRDATPSSSTLEVCMHLVQTCTAKRDAAARRIIPTARISGLDVRRGHAAVGGIIGVLLGAGGGYLVGHDIQTHECAGSCAAPAIGTILGAALLGGVGALLGGGVARWVPMP